MPERVKCDFSGQTNPGFSNEKAHPSALPLVPCLDVSRSGRRYEQSVVSFTTKMPISMSFEWTGTTRVLASVFDVYPSSECDLTIN